MTTRASVGVLVCLFAAGSARAEWGAELVESRVIWDGAAKCMLTDLARFRDRWYAVCVEGNDEHLARGVLRVVSSEDGRRWESVAALECRFPMRGSRDPKLIAGPRRLTLLANSSVPGATILPTLWSTKDGRDWGEPKHLRDSGFRVTSLSRHDGVTYGYGHGCICGSAQTVHILASNKSAKRFEQRFEETFSGFFPNDAALLFSGDEGYCLMDRGGTAEKHRTALLGRAVEPFDDWQWTALESAIRHPSLARLDDGTVLATVVRDGDEPGMSLCRFDPKQGTFDELLPLPKAGRAQTVGLVAHDGHAWITFHAETNGRIAMHLAKVRLTR